MSPSGTAPYGAVMTGLHLDAGARLVLDVALGTAGAMGDDHCGTEHLLFGVVATARGDMAELIELFALDTLRVERALNEVKSRDRTDWVDEHHDPPLTPRAEMAVSGHSWSGDDEISRFDVLVALLEDPRSGAAMVLRQLGVRVGDVRRLAELGAARLEPSEVEGLIASLDRRDERHRPWWGPSPDGPVAAVTLADRTPIELARSESAVASLDGVVTGSTGFGFTIAVTSRRDWVLPPRWEPTEMLVPGLGAEHRVEPELVTIDLRYADGTLLTNRTPGVRWRSDPPTHGALVRLGGRTVVDERNDRRVAPRRSVTSDWWAWPLPTEGEVSVLVEWKAEAMGGSVVLDAAAITARSGELREPI